MPEADETSSVIGASLGASTSGLQLQRCSEEPAESRGRKTSQSQRLRSLAPAASASTAAAASINALCSPLAPLSHLLSPLHSPSILSPSPTFGALALPAGTGRSEERGYNRELPGAASATSAAPAHSTTCGPSHGESQRAAASSHAAAQKLSFASVFSVARPSTSAAATTTTFSQTSVTPILSNFAVAPSAASTSPRDADANLFLRSAIAARSRRSIRQHSNDALLLSPNAPYAQSATSSPTQSRERVWPDVEGGGGHMSASVSAPPPPQNPKQQPARKGAEAKRKQWLEAPQSNAAEPERERERERAARAKRVSRPLSAAHTVDRERGWDEMLV